MALFWSMLPIYILGNLHCLGMCGPLAMMIGRHQYRFLYILGRITSFTMAGMIAGEAGAILSITLKNNHLGALASFIFAVIFLAIGLANLTGYHFPINVSLARLLEPLNRTVGLLMLKDQPLPTFLFGFFTVFLPCGQTLLVFSACALSGSLAVGFWNGLAFALLTTPSLWISMHAHSWLNYAKKYYQTVLGIAALAVGTLTLCRGLADMEWIPHLVISEHYHMVIY